MRMQWIPGLPSPSPPQKAWGRGYTSLFIKIIFYFSHTPTPCTVLAGELLWSTFYFWYYLAPSSVSMSGERNSNDEYFPTHSATCLTLVYVHVKMLGFKCDILCTNFLVCVRIIIMSTKIDFDCVKVYVSSIWKGSLAHLLWLRMRLS